MTSDTEDPDSAADRLEAALERIAHVATRDEAAREHQVPLAETEEIAARLDGLIDRLRSALGDKAAGQQG